MADITGSPTDGGKPQRQRRSEPIDVRTAKDGTKTYTFQIDVGIKPDGSRDRQRFTYSTKSDARREFRRISSEVAAGTFVKLTDLTVDEACDLWLEGKRAVRINSLEGYRKSLKPVRRRLGEKKLRDLTKNDGDDLVTWMITEGRVDPRSVREGSVASRVAAFVAEHPEGVTRAQVKAAFPDINAGAALSCTIRTGRLTRPRRAVYVAVDRDKTNPDPQGCKPVTIRQTLMVLSMVVQSFVDQGALPRNVVTLVERPKDSIEDDDDEHASATTPKTWTPDEVQTFRDSVRDDRLYACWLMSCYGMRRSEILGLRWFRVDDSLLKVRRGRVPLSKGSPVEGLPKSKRSRRNLPLPSDLAAALRTLKRIQMTECLARGETWSDDRLVAIHEDGTPIAPQRYTNEFHRLRESAGLRRIQLRHLRNTSVSLMLALKIPVHVVAAWHGHDPAMSLGVYSEAQPADLKSAGTLLHALQTGSLPHTEHPVDPRPHGGALA
ncbi:site-specific integrase [Nocardia bhagyanarayanae]|uniref:Phage integrase family protein n=1 Tax=Nocardia bhagyanarayanae TaxID=1215925 RepID=A0A543FFN1_9NOCA|nr:site-specific integrase [Nocardia bhagyanarayanae]TQM32546.1 phage integrase family protein [Nocardia bhagyanarayanae]